jgi:hypothetical protein
MHVLVSSCITLAQVSLMLYMCADLAHCCHCCVVRADVNTTTEFMCKAIYDDLIRECPEFEGDICVKLWESHKAWACYTGTTSKPAVI